MSLGARLRIVAAVLSGAVLLALPAASLAADPMRVDVVDDRYDDGNRDGNASEEDGERRNHTVITAGETVEWVWKGEDRHTVTSQPTSPKAFDSDSECAEQDDNTACRTKPNTFAVRFEEPGTYDYICKRHGLLMTGTIEVLEASEPSEGPSEDEGSSEPSSEPEPEEPSSEPEPEDEEPSSEPQEEPREDEADETDEGGDEQQPSTDDGADDGAERPSRRQATGPGFGVRQQPERRSAPGPEIAPETAPKPTYSPFPTAPSPPDDTETDDMAVTVPTRGGDGPPRGVVVGVAVASLLGSAGALGKLVLFGQPWA